jgi:hypothetical protein
MEHRQELKELLLSGLPESERRDTVTAMANARAAELARLRRQGAQTTCTAV